MDRIRTRALGDPVDPKVRMVPLYHGGIILNMQNKRINSVCRSSFS
ncbi:hypothetical protein E2C01_052509 [Portunus trituberculatus]|uniref:Uncharacterized protein n=1 Tax=Portunus trituberculatus TaxID=210409 RepID=A0A5B7GLZ6_PORTR|nr:hypothetical protein [Portunus trituberculatus]